MRKLKTRAYNVIGLSRTPENGRYIPLGEIQICNRYGRSFDYYDAIMYVPYRGERVEDGSVRHECSVFDRHIMVPYGAPYGLRSLFNDPPCVVPVYFRKSTEHLLFGSDGRYSRTSSYKFWLDDAEAHL